MRLIDYLLDRITMYRLILYFLLILVGIAVVLGALGILPYSPLSIILSTLLLTGGCWATNMVFSHVFEAPTNIESAYITALILSLISFFMSS